MASVEQLTERILYRLSLGMQVRALAERLLHRFAETVGDLPASEKHQHPSPSNASARQASLFTHRLPCSPHQTLTKRTEITEHTKLNVKDCSFCKYDPVFPEPNFPVRADEIIGWQAHLKSFREALRHRPTTDKVACFALHGKGGAARAAGCSRPPATCTGPSCQILSVPFSFAKDISDCMKFDEAFGGTALDSKKMAEWLFSKTIGHPYLLMFISPRTSPCVQRFPHIYFKRLSEREREAISIINS